MFPHDADTAFFLCCRKYHGGMQDQDYVIMNVFARCAARSFFFFFVQARPFFSRKSCPTWNKVKRDVSPLLIFLSFYHHHQRISLLSVVLTTTFRINSCILRHRNRMCIPLGAAPTSPSWFILQVTPRSSPRLVPPCPTVVVIEPQLRPSTRSPNPSETVLPSLFPFPFPSPCIPLSIHNRTSSQLSTQEWLQMRLALSKPHDLASPSSYGKADCRLIGCFDLNLGVKK